MVNLLVDVAKVVNRLAFIALLDCESRQRFGSEFVLLKKLVEINQFEYT